MAVIAGVFALALAVRGVWRIRGLYRIHRAGPRPLRAKHHRIWRDPGPAERRDLVYGPGGRRTVPVPPFVFLEEHLTGSQPCVSVRDASGRRWRVKWGAEVFAESFAARFAHACGYFAEVTHFVRTGTIECKAALARAGDCITGDEGAFFDGRFELDDPHVNMLFDEHSWAWNDNPFRGTAELSEPLALRARSSGASVSWTFEIVAVRLFRWPPATRVRGSSGTIRPRARSARRASRSACPTRCAVP